MKDQFSMKELYQVKLKATQSMELNGKQIAEGETIAYFDSIQMSLFDEDKTYVSAHGGYYDTPFIFWEATRDVRVAFSKGIFSKVQFALMSNSRLLNVPQGEYLHIPNYEEAESDEEGIITFSHAPVCGLFIYNKQTGEKLTATRIDSTHYKIDSPYVSVILDYYYEYSNGCNVTRIGHRQVTGFLSLEGRTEVQDDVTGQKRTGIIVIPKFKLMSDLSLRLGERAEPMVGQFNGVAIAQGPRENKQIMEIYLLNDKIDGE